MPDSSPHPMFEAVETEAQRALKERPSFSVRTRISLGFLLLFLVSLGITVASLLILDRIEDKLLFLESATSYTFEIQQARRFEKNYFLYGTNLDDALEHVRNAEATLEGQSEPISDVVGKANFDTMERHLKRYEGLLVQLSEFKDQPSTEAPPHHPEIEAELRGHGAQMVKVAQDLVNEERHSVNTMLLMSQRVPIAFLVVLFFLIIYMTNFLTRQILQPLNRMMQATRRIADGDFTPITPRRRYRDEFTDLGLAMNHMMSQLTHRQAMLVQAHKLQAVGTLTAGVAHELNNPINNIMLTACMLAEDYESLPSEERLDMTNDLVDQAERAQRIVRNLLDFARESEIKTGLLQIDGLLEETLRLASNQLKLAKVTVKKSYATNLPSIRGDRQQISQVFLNLVLNAIDAMPKGGSMTVSTFAATEPDFLEVEFTDTGFGIPEHILPRVFDPFFTTKHTGKGTGLGLSVSLGILREHGGDIRVLSQTGKGTTFTVVLPVAKVPVRIEEGSKGISGGGVVQTPL